jgi:hypothetical protein
MSVPPGAVMHFVTPTYRPAGGVVKVFDYLVHALDLGYDAHVHCPAAAADDDPLFSIPRFRRLRDNPRVHFHEGIRCGLDRRDWLLFSWPPHYEQIARGMSNEVAHERVIHLVQNTRHANPQFADGYALRLLARPMARIMVAHEVMHACRPHLNGESSSTTIVEAHDWNYFHRSRSGGWGDLLRVAYTTWKSDLGLKVQRAMEQPFRFRSIRRTASWTEVRELLHWCDVFLCCPGPEEGFYLPGLEAMAAGAIVLTPDVGGNRAYARFGENCVQVPFEDVESTVSALQDVQRWPAGRVHEMRERAYASLTAHTLDRERESFGQLLIDLAGRRRHAMSGS